MRHAVEHINLLQRRAPQRSASRALAAVLAVTVLGAGYYGSGLRQTAAAATAQRDATAAELKLLQARMAAQAVDQKKAAETAALRAEIAALKPQADAARVLLDAVRAADNGRSDDFGRALAAITAVSEPGLWLTSVMVGNAGRQLELAGEARNSALVLRYARRANDALQPLGLRLPTLGMTPPSGSAAAAAAGAAAGIVAFRLN